MSRRMDVALSIIHLLGTFGSKVTVEAAVVPNDLTSNKPSPGLAEPELSMDYIVSCEMTTICTATPEQNQTRPFSSVSPLIDTII